MKTGKMNGGRVAKGPITCQIGNLPHEAKQMLMHSMILAAADG